MFTDIYCENQCKFNKNILTIPKLEGIIYQDNDFMEN